MQFTQEYVQAILDYNPYTGICLWKSRPRTDFKISHKRAEWNRKHVGLEAGNIDPSSSRLKVSLFGKAYALDELIWIYVYGEQPTTIHHINGWNVDNSLKNLILDRTLSKRPTKYEGGDLLLIRSDAEADLPTIATHFKHEPPLTFLPLTQRHRTLDRYLILAGQHCMGLHADAATARTHMLETCEYLQCGWENTLEPSSISHKYEV